MIDVQGRTMTPTEYQHLAARTRAADQVGKKGLMCWGLGLCGEAGEVMDLIKKEIFHDHPKDIKKLVKEAGDTCWYVAMAATDTGMKLEDLFAMTSDSTGEIDGVTDHPLTEDEALNNNALRLGAAAGKVADHFRRHVFYNDPLSTAYVQIQLGRMLGALAVLVGDEISMEEVCILNIDKLKLRYPDGFSAEKSINRVKEA